jgi:transcriptional regulator with XRE-family HTH domain
MKVIDKEIIVAEFGSFIRDARESKGLLQAEVAEEVGVSRSYYAYIETGKREIYFSLAINICRVLDLDINHFIKTLK